MLSRTSVSKSLVLSIRASDPKVPSVLTLAMSLFANPNAMKLLWASAFSMSISSLVNVCKRSSLSQATASSVNFAVICPKISKANSLSFVSDEFIPKLDKSWAHKLCKMTLETGHSGMSSAVRISRTAFCSKALISISCALAECQPSKSCFQK